MKIYTRVKQIWVQKCLLARQACIEHDRIQKFKFQEYFYTNKWCGLPYHNKSKLYRKIYIYQFRWSVFLHKTIFVNNNNNDKRPWNVKLKLNQPLSINKRKNIYILAKIKGKKKYWLQSFVKFKTPKGFVSIFGKKIKIKQEKNSQKKPIFSVTHINL